MMATVANDLRSIAAQNLHDQSSRIFSDVLLSLAQACSLHHNLHVLAVLRIALVACLKDVLHAGSENEQGAAKARTTNLKNL